jgi:hypothetical protein
VCARVHARVSNGGRSSPIGTEDRARPEDGARRWAGPRRACPGPPGPRRQRAGRTAPGRAPEAANGGRRRVGSVSPDGRRGRAEAAGECNGAKQTVGVGAPSDVRGRICEGTRRRRRGRPGGQRRPPAPDLPSHPSGQRRRSTICNTSVSRVIAGSARDPPPFDARRGRGRARRRPLLLAAPGSGTPRPASFPVGARSSFRRRKRRNGKPNRPQLNVDKQLGVMFEGRQ